MILSSTVFGRPEDEEGNEIPEQNCDHYVEQDGRNLFMVLGDEKTPVFNNTRVSTIATFVRDRKKTQQCGEEQSARKDAFEDCGEMLA
jgi:hypothetical protein